jgi:hypothetical protein
MDGDATYYACLGIWCMAYASVPRRNIPVFFTLLFNLSMWTTGMGKVAIHDGGGSAYFLPLCSLAISSLCTASLIALPNRPVGNIFMSSHSLVFLVAMWIAPGTPLASQILATISLCLFAALLVRAQRGLLTWSWYFLNVQVMLAYFQGNSLAVISYCVYVLGASLLFAPWFDMYIWLNSAFWLFFLAFPVFATPPGFTPISNPEFFLLPSSASTGFPQLAAHLLFATIALSTLLIAAFRQTCRAQERNEDDSGDEGERVHGSAASNQNTSPIAWTGSARIP